MNQVKEILEKRQQDLLRILNDLRKREKKIPDGYLKVAVKSGRPYYIHVIGKEQKYLGKKDKELVYALAQKSHDKKLRKRIESELNSIEDFLKHHAQNGVEELYPSLSEARRKLLKHHIITDDEYAEIWLQRAEQEKAEDIIPVPYMIDEGRGFFTDKGELVRSKSEKIIADKLFHAGIPYVYEMPLDLGRFGILHPDFTILNVYSREIFYWEHLGMMDNPDYSEKALSKINTYELNHILPGKQLILTHETSHRPLDTRIIDEIISAYFC